LNLHLQYYIAVDVYSLLSGLQLLDAQYTEQETTAMKPATCFTGIVLGVVIGLQLQLLMGGGFPYRNEDRALSCTIPTSLLQEDFSLARYESSGFIDDISNSEWQRMKQKVQDTYPNVMGTIEKVRTQDVSANVFYQNHYEPDFACRHEQRLGQRGDGGKWVCDPHRLQKYKGGKDIDIPCLVYSVGSCGDVSFEEAVKADIGSHCEIHVFDMADYSAVVEKTGAIFHQWGVSDHTFKDTRGLVYKSLQETVQELGHVGRTVDIFKTDCEGCEWDTYPAFFESGVELRQILIELHSTMEGKGIYNPMPLPQSVDFFDSMYRHGYVIFHKEVNIQHWEARQCIEYAFLKLHKDFFNGIPELSDS
jgi:hypothetical protein